MSCLILTGSGLSVLEKVRAQGFCSNSTHSNYLSEPQFSSSLKWESYYMLFLTCWLRVTDLLIKCFVMSDTNGKCNYSLICRIKRTLLRLGLGEAKHRDKFVTVPLVLYMHGFPQLGWGLHTFSDYVRNWVIWSPRWTVPIGLLCNWICCSLFRGCLEQRRPPDKHLQWAPSRIDY